ncbi:unnamed protein product [Albugo candida]|uniref:Sfi1 spindle body domain-containing protein n=1 Tax=Albugo candida TaxID=65357 RepID=A0A024G6W1_9STRA|nr:unnamed protein product [Albugo candida]|eukprot:CCI42055.1 unnamed protein product [Albugo candida]
MAEDGISGILSPQRNDQGELGICYLNESLLELPGRVAHCDRVKFGHTEQTFVFDIKRQASRRGNQSHTLVSVRERIRELLMQASSDTAIDEVADKRLHELHERFDEGESCPQISPARAAVMHPPSSLCSSASSHEDVVRYPLPPEQRERVQNEKNRLLQRLRDANHILVGFQPFEGSALAREMYLRSESGKKTKESLVISKQSASSLQRNLIDRRIQRKQHQFIFKVFTAWRLGIRIQAHRRRIRHQQIATFDMWKHQNRFQQHFYRWKAIASQQSQACNCRVEGFQDRHNFRQCFKILAKWRLETELANRKRWFLRQIIFSINRRFVEHGFSIWRRSTAYKMLQSFKKLEYALTKRLEHRRSQVARSFHLRIFRRVIQSWSTVAYKRVRMRRFFVHVGARLKERILHQAWTLWETHTRILFLLNTKKKEATEQLVFQNKKALAAHHNAKEQMQSEIRDLKCQVHEQKEQLNLEELVSRKRQAGKSAILGSPQTLEAFLQARVEEFDQHIQRITICLDRTMLLAETNPAQARRSAACLLVHILLEQRSRNCREQIQLHEFCLSGSVFRQKDALSRPSLQYSHDILSQRLSRLYQLYQSLAEVAALKSVGQVDLLKHQHAKYLAERIYLQMKAQIGKIIALYTQ